MELKKVRLFRVKMNALGMLPKGWPEGMLTGMTAEEVKSLDKNPQLKECFEEVELMPASEEKKP